MAFETARFGRKLLAADRDVERYRDRMNAIAEIQAGVSTNPIPKEDDVEVFTNSPITTTTKNYYKLPSPDPDSNWLKTLVLLFAILAAIGWYLAVQPVPQPPAPALDIGVIQNPPTTSAKP